MKQLDVSTAEELLRTTTTQPHLFQHAWAVSCAMAAMASHFGENPQYWAAVGLLHDYDYEKYPEEHLQHTEAELRAAGVDEESIRAILSHGWGQITNLEPQSMMEKSLYTLDSLTGLISATAKMRPTGISDLTATSVVKKFKDKSFAAGVHRDLISQGLEMMGMERAQAITICIEGMKTEAKRLGLTPKE